MKQETLKVEEEVKLKFDKLQFDLKIKEKKKRTQSEIINMLINFFKHNNSKLTNKEIQRESER